MTPRALLTSWFLRGVEACHPRTVLPPVLPDGAPAGRNIVLGAGKAAAAMAAVAHARLEGPTEGLVVTRYGHTTTEPTGDIEVIEADHPVPDESSVDAARRMLALAESAAAGDRVIFLFSGGGSALLCAPVEGISARRKQEVTRFLLASGAPIGEINLVRKHMSAIKGGGLASRVAAAEMYTLVISDVVGDDPSDVASGPSIGITRNPEAALNILKNYGYKGSKDIRTALASAGQFVVREHPVSVAATSRDALESIRHAVEAKGWEPIILGDDLVGDASDTGRRHARLAIEHYRPGARKALISGGELTVRVRNPNGRGGRNLEYLVGLMLGLNGTPGISALACDSDGIDGTEDNAGACFDAGTIRRAVGAGIDFAALLSENRCYDGFERLGELVVTGPTLTNVNDIRIILIDGTPS